MKAGWEIRKLECLVDVITKGTTPTSVGHQFKDHGINFIKVESFKDNGEFIHEKFGYIDADCHNSLARSQLKENDILFSIAGALGRTTIVTETSPAGPVTGQGTIQ